MRSTCAVCVIHMQVELNVAPVGSFEEVEDGELLGCDAAGGRWAEDGAEVEEVEQVVSHLE